jgi:hypothetical protein
MAAGAHTRVRRPSRASGASGMTVKIWIGAAALVLSIASCEALTDSKADAVSVPEKNSTTAAHDGAPAGVVDSMFPMSQMIERFQRQQGRVVTSLGAAAPDSRDALVRAFAAAVESGDARALRRLRLDAAEFAYLYFPISIYALPPYEQPPATQWMLMNQQSITGERLVLRRLGGATIGLRGYTCGEPIQAAGGSALWDDCRVIMSPSGGAPDTVLLFGPIIRYDGRYKFVSLGNSY